MLISDARALHNLEDWSPASAKGPSKYMGLMEDFQMRILASAKKVAHRQGEKEALPGVFKRKIRGDFVDTMCFLFDGILNSTSLSHDAGPRRMSRMSSSRLMTIKDLVSLRLRRSHR
jgi:exocyst complex component 2